jgi:hypothetical protein
MSMQRLRFRSVTKQLRYSSERHRFRWKRWKVIFELETVSCVSGGNDTREEVVESLMPTSAIRVGGIKRTSI